MERYTQDAVEEIRAGLRECGCTPPGFGDLIAAMEHDMGARGSKPPLLPLPTQDEVTALVEGRAPKGLRDWFPSMTALIDKARAEYQP